MIQSRSSPYLLRFRSLFESGRGYAFPCDDSGRVDLDDLSESARNNYLYARAMVGRELAMPAVEPALRCSVPDVDWPRRDDSLAGR
jgi:hypothetical protein